MIVHFCRSDTLGGALIRFATFSQWNHAAVEVDGIVFDATLRHGVTCWRHDHFVTQYSRIETVEVDGMDEQKALSFLCNQMGKSYDWTALLALPFRADWQKESRWFCSEIVAKCLIVSGLKTPPIKSSRITPRDLVLLLGRGIDDR